MTRPVRISLIAAGGVALLSLLVVVGGVSFVRSQWFYDKVRERIVTEVEKATGGRVEIASFDFDWQSLTAHIKGFTVHGTEPDGDPPLLHADDLVVGLKIISILKRDVDISLLRVERPQAFLLIDDRGGTNVPNPKAPKATNKSSLETILDLAVRRLELNNGSIEIRSAGQAPNTQTYDAKGDNLRALFTYDAAVPRYHGEITIAPLNFTYGEYKPPPSNVATQLAIEKNRIVLEQAILQQGDSSISMNGRLENLSAPVLTAEYKARISVSQVGAVLKLKSKQSGWVEASGSASYKSVRDFAIHGLIKAYDIDYHAPGVNLRRVSAQAKIDGGPKTISVDDIKVFAWGGQITGKAEIKDFERVKLNGDLHHLDIQGLASLAIPDGATTQKLPYDGLINGPIFLEGRISELAKGILTGTARVNISPSGTGIPMHGLLDAKYNGVQSTVDLGQSFVALPNTRLDVAGVLGSQLKIHLVSSNLNDLLPALNMASSPGQGAPAIPVTVTPRGQVGFDGLVTGKLENPTLTGHLNGTDFIAQDQRIEALDLDVAALKSGVTVTNGTLRQKALAATFAGTVGLRNWKADNDEPLTASVRLNNADLQNLLDMAGQKGAPASGILNANAKVSGSIGNPQAGADLSLIHGVLQGEPFDRLTMHLDAPDRATQTLSAVLNAGPKQVNLTATYSHGKDDWMPGRLAFKVNSNTIAVNQIVTLHEREPDLSGTATMSADGELRVSRGSDGKPAIVISRVNADVSAAGLQLQDRRLGDVRLTASTLTSGGSAPLVQVKLRSDLAHADITGDGSWTLSGDYPGTAKLQFAKVDLDTLRRLVLTPDEAQSMPIGGSLEGTLDVAGPAAKPDQLKATLVIPSVEVHPLPGVATAPAGINLSVRNSEPIRVTLAADVVRVESAHIVAQDSDFTVAGRVTLAPQQDLNLRAGGRINLGIVHMINNDIESGGTVIANASVRGTFSDPQLAGSLQLKDATLALVDVPNGLTHITGNVVFSENQATIQSLTGESGGGKVSVTGFAAVAGGNLTFRVNADANGVRIRYPQGVSTVADANLNLVGSTKRSLLSGTVTIDRLAFNPKTDLGSVLSSGAAPPETPSAQTGAAANMQFDVQIQTAPDITFVSSYTQSVEADANLRLRGTVANPVLLGRVNVTQGDLTFFGNTYTINQGSVSFFNPVKLEPVLNVDLETITRGVDVILTVSGPITKLNVSYRSDPPLEFSDIVALLATGRAPNDASIAARQPTAPQQSWQQMGASALVGQAIANPVAGRLQRFFGVSKLKIDPTLSGVTGNPTATVSLEQQITPEITFTYITDVANTQEQIIRVEWAFSPTISAVALRDQNGEFGIDFLYKKRFK